MKLISIIIPAYNIEDYIGKCIESVIRQTYENLEIILVDDGASDSTPQICSRYEKKDSRIKIIHQKNGGLSAARNTGIDAAAGEYLYFVDGDDLIHPECIERLCNIIEQEGCDIVQCMTHAFLDESKIHCGLSEQKLIRLNGKQMCRCLMYNSSKSNPTIVWNKMYKKELFDGIRFPEGMVYEDVATTYRLYWKSKKIVLTNQTMAFYRSKRKNSITHSGHRHFEDQVKAQAIRMEFFRARGEKSLYEQGLYLLCNDYMRLRVYRGRDGTGAGIKAEHKKMSGLAGKSGLPVRKKIIILTGFCCPKILFFLCEKRDFVRRAVVWRKGE